MNWMADNLNYIVIGIYFMSIIIITLGALMTGEQIIPAIGMSTIFAVGIIAMWKLRLK